MNDDEDRIEGLERLARRRAPARDLWPGIEARLAPRVGRRYATAQLALAASVVAALAGVFALQMPREPIAPAPAVAAAQPMLTTDSRAIVEANLAMAQQAERQVRRALRQDPHSPALRSLLASTETRQRELRAML